MSDHTCVICGASGNEVPGVEVCRSHIEEMAFPSPPMDLEALGETLDANPKIAKEIAKATGLDEVSPGFAEFLTGIAGVGAGALDRALATHPPEKFTLRHEVRHWADGGDRFYVDRNGETFALCPDLAAAERIIGALSGDE